MKREEALQKLNGIILGWSLFIGMPLLAAGLIFPGDRVVQFSVVIVGFILMELFWDRSP